MPRHSIHCCLSNPCLVCQPVGGLIERLRDYDRTTAAKDMVDAAARIAELEAALRTIAEQRLVYDGDAGGNYELRFNHIVLSARAILVALAEGQDK